MKSSYFVPNAGHDKSRQQSEPAPDAGVPEAFHPEGEKKALKRPAESPDPALLIKWPEDLEPLW